MFNLISSLINLNASLANKARAVLAYDEALALHKDKHYRQALPLMIEASELGNAQAMSVLGTMYLMGQGVEEGGGQAIVCLQRAIDAGFEGAISVLGMAYATGKGGVGRDIVKARQMLDYCAKKGDEQSGRMLSMIDAGEGILSPGDGNGHTRSRRNSEVSAVREHSRAGQSREFEFAR